MTSQDRFLEVGGEPGEREKTGGVSGTVPARFAAGGSVRAGGPQILIATGGGDIPPAIALAAAHAQRRGLRRESLRIAFTAIVGSSCRMEFGNGNIKEWMPRLDALAPLINQRVRDHKPPRL